MRRAGGSGVFELEELHLTIRQPDRDSVWTLRRKGNGGKLETLAGEYRKALAAGQVPPTQRAVKASREGVPAVSAQRHGNYAVGEAFQDAQALAAGQVPPTQRAVIASREGVPAVPAQRHGPD